MDWPENPEGGKLTFIIHLPMDFVNEALGTSYPEHYAISVFTTYHKEDYFLDRITYHGDPAELAIIQNGYTKVIAHPIGQPRNESNFIIPAREMILSETVEGPDYIGSKMGGKPGYVQQESLSLDHLLFCLQLYGSDFGEDFKDIFFLSDAVGYLFLNVLENENDAGIFFTQCS